jgi:predicted ABC-type ATPase
LGKERREITLESTCIRRYWRSIDDWPTTIHRTNQSNVYSQIKEEKKIDGTATTIHGHGTIRAD